MNAHLAPLSADALARLRELHSVAPPPPWEIWTSNSVVRITGPDRKDGAVLSGYVRQDGCPDLSAAPGVIDLIVTMRNVLPALLNALDTERKRADEAHVAALKAAAKICLGEAAKYPRHSDALTALRLCAAQMRQLAEQVTLPGAPDGKEEL
jgi:hypothetical protein